MYEIAKYEARVDHIINKVSGGGGLPFLYASRTYPRKLIGLNKLHYLVWLDCFKYNTEAKRMELAW
jgi:hypothetical protein